MKTIEVDEDLYRYIAGQTKHIGESASDILRRIINIDGAQQQPLVQSVEAPQSEVIVSQERAITPVDNIKEMRALLISDEFATLKKAIDRFMLVLSTLYILDKTGFLQATEVKGRKRVYFADNEATLLANGNTTKPKEIPSTPYWVITNNNTSRKRQMVEQVMTHMTFPADLIEKVTNSI